MQKKIGILGFGVVGKSALNFLQNLRQENKLLKLHQDCIDLTNSKISIWDQNTIFCHPELDSGSILPSRERGDNQPDSNKIDIFDATKLSMRDFIESQNYIIPSPGINLNDFYSCSHKFACELDFFSAYFKKPAIAITGSLGKTTTTKLFGELLLKIKQTGKITPFVGGNIGLGMLEAIEKQDSYDMGVLELSSFQLEFSKTFAPDLAILMNCYPNHLDRHKSFKDYFQAKFNLFRYQREHQYALLPWQILQGDTSALFAQEACNIKSNLCFISDSPVDTNLPATIFAQAGILKPYKIFHKQGDSLVLFDSGSHTTVCHAASPVIFDMSVLPDVTFVHNWIFIIAGLYLLGADLQELQNFFEKNGKDFAIDDHHHRVEYFATVNGVRFYDDSKATVIQSTLAAVKSLINKGPVYLILGGLNKGVDRSPIIPELAKIKELKKVYCYGPACNDFGAASCNLGSLEEILNDISKSMQPGDQVLFSPSGTSFDFYKNYKQRGQAFKDLVLKLPAKPVG